MATLKQMCEAGMMMQLLEQKVKENESINFDTRIYLADKLDDAFFNIQADISLAVAEGIGFMGEDGDEDA